MMKLKHVGVLHAIMVTGSITEAGRLLNVSQPAVSAALRHIEDQLGMNLFERTGGRLKPTPEADLIFPDIQNIVDRFATLNRFLTSLAEGQAGSVVIAVNTVVLGGPLPAVMADFCAANPDVRLVVQRLPTAQVIERVSRREADVGVTILPASHAHSNTETLYMNEVSCVMRSDHPLASRDNVHVADIPTSELISYTPSSMIGLQLSQVFNDEGVPFEPHIAVNEALSARLIVNAIGKVAVVVRARDSEEILPHLIYRPFRPNIAIKTVLVIPEATPVSQAASKLITSIRRVMKDSS